MAFEALASFISKDGFDAKTNHSPKQLLPVVKCGCGFEIVLIPDLKAMSQAIEKHCIEHKTKEANEAQIDKIINELITQALKKAAQLNL